MIGSITIKRLGQTGIGYHYVVHDNATEMHRLFPDPIPDAFLKELFIYGYAWQQ